MKNLPVFVIITVLVLVCEGKVFTRCQLASELLKLNIFKKTFLGSWVCLIEKVSSRNTKAFTVTPGGKKLYGLYQIPQKYCREGKRGGVCNVACESLLDDNIRDDTLCAEKIFQQEGFKFWTQWTTRCKNDNFITTEIYKSRSGISTALTGARGTVVAAIIVAAIIVVLHAPSFLKRGVKRLQAFKVPSSKSSKEQCQSRTQIQRSIEVQETYASSID